MINYRLIDIHANYNHVILMSFFIFAWMERQLVKIFGNLQLVASVLIQEGSKPDYKPDESSNSNSQKKVKIIT